MAISKLSLGSVQWGKPYGVSNSNGQTDFKEVNRILTKARSVGIRLIDTAGSYGDAEDVLGKNNLSYFSIVTKASKFENKSISKVEVDDLSLKFKQSLLKLNQSSCYGLLIHQKEDIFKNGNQYLIETLNKLKLKGLVKKIGISLYDSNDIDEVIERLRPDIIQLPINVLDQRFIKDGSLNYIKSKNIEVHARSVFLQGLLLMPSKKTPVFFKTWIKKINEWKNTCKKKNINYLSAALNFVIKQNNVDYCLAGVENLIQLEQCIRATETSEIYDFSEFACNDLKLINPNNWKIK
jgi:aryl-alcohol dehydrogenase-like predicted oxidoreductase